MFKPTEKAFLLKQGLLTIKIDEKGVQTLKGGKRYILDNHDESMFGVAERINPKREYLFVNHLLSRHTPQPSNHIDQQLAYYKLAYPVMCLIAKQEQNIKGFIEEKHNPFQSKRINGNTLIVSMAETATQMGYKLAEQMMKFDPYILNQYAAIDMVHSTREPESSVYIEFSEDHSHATKHYLQVKNLHEYDNLVLIDDEITTGNTFKSALTAMLKKGLRPKQIITVSFLNWNNSIGELADLTYDTVGYRSKESSICLNNGSFVYSSLDLKNIEKQDNCTVYEDTGLDLGVEIKGIPRLYKNVTACRDFYATETDVSSIIKDFIKKNAGENNRNLVVAFGENYYQADRVAYHLNNAFRQYAFDVCSITRSPILNTTKIKKKIHSIKDLAMGLVKGFETELEKDLISDSVIERKFVFKANKQLNKKTNPDRYLYNVDPTAYDSIIIVCDNANYIGSLSAFSADLALNENAAKVLIIEAK